MFEYSEMDSDQCPNCFGTMEECTTSPVVTNEGGWEDVVNNFIKKWCGENASHLLDTDDNDGQKLRCFISSTIIEEHRKEQEDILLQIEKEISEKKRDRDYIKIPKEFRIVTGKQHIVTGKQVSQSRSFPVTKCPSHEVSQCFPVTIDSF